jgi:hypothetical protein
MPEEMRIYMDLWLQRGAKLEALDDGDVEMRRLMAAPSRELRCAMVKRARGQRRSWWRQPPPGVPVWSNGVPGWAWLTYEPKMERQLGEPGAKTDNKRAKRTHWR